MERSLTMTTQSPNAWEATKCRPAGNDGEASGLAFMRCHSPVVVSIQAPSRSRVPPSPSPPHTTSASLLTTVADAARGESGESTCADSMVDTCVRSGTDGRVDRCTDGGVDRCTDGAGETGCAFV